MKTAITIILLALYGLLISTSVFAQGVRADFPNYGQYSQALSGTPGTQGGAAAGFWNPAAWAAMRKWEASFLWNDHSINQHRMDNWGLFLGGHGVGFSMYRHDFVMSPTKNGKIDDYQISLGGGDPDNYWGAAYGWSRGNRNDTSLVYNDRARDQYFSLGNIYRPCRHFSMGNAAYVGIKHGDYRGINDIGIRPLGNNLVTLFADAAYARYDNPTTMQWGAGIEVRPIDGVSISGKISKPFADSQDKVYSIGVGLSLSGTGLTVVPHYDKDSKRTSTSYMLRVGEQQPTFNLAKYIDKHKKTLSLSMKGDLSYQKARFFDADRIRFWDTMQLIDKAKNDPEVGAIAINLSGFDGSRELIWELREKLIDFKKGETGCRNACCPTDGNAASETNTKKVYVYLDRADMYTYYLASAADYIWMDPQGAIIMPGFIMGRTYWKGFLEKIGIGSEEWRFFDYKSAFEGFVRKDMSPKDKEQRLALISDFFDQWVKDIAQARGVTVADIRKGVDSTFYFNPTTALEAKLVDTLARWDDAKDILKGIQPDEPEFVSRKDVSEGHTTSQSWGKRPEVAVVYAIGECDMETGIRGRYTSKLLNTLSNDNNVKAVILRADSPGGDALPSDLVAEKMKKVSEKKPMIVSQGNVAGSGGYWISMNGDRIFASPFTITGSIGVIGGWFWNEKLGEKTGFTSDYVKVGEHAELGFGITLPLIGLTIPDRNLTTEEHAFVEKMLRNMYGEFTGKVAKGRMLEKTYVDSVGQGRVWAGQRAIDVKLIDEIGGLEQAITYAEKKAKIKCVQDVDIVEYPKQELFNFGQMSRSPLSVCAKLLGYEAPMASKESSDYEFSVIKRISQAKGEPVYMVAPEDIPAE